MIGDESAVEPLIAFIEDADDAGGLSREHYAAKTSALMALGYLINKTGNQRALDYLKESLDPHVWVVRDVAGTAPFQASMIERNHDLSKHAILGLAVSGHPEAAEALRSLQHPAQTDTQRAFQAQVSDVVSEALQEHQKVSSQGLAEYYRKTQP
jgi:HEAT repeat protein